MLKGVPTASLSWDPVLAAAFGAAMGAGQFAKGQRHVMLGPGVSRARVPWDVAAQMAAALVPGAQSQNVSACVKHFAGNSLEAHRTSASSSIPRVCHEGAVLREPQCHLRRVLRHAQCAVPAARACICCAS